MYIYACVYYAVEIEVIGLHVTIKLEDIMRNGDNATIHRFTLQVADINCDVRMLIIVFNQNTLGVLIFL